MNLQSKPINQQAVYTIQKHHRRNETHPPMRGKAMFLFMHRINTTTNKNMQRSSLRVGASRKENCNTLQLVTIVTMRCNARTYTMHMGRFRARSLLGRSLAGCTLARCLHICSLAGCTLAGWLHSMLPLNVCRLHARWLPTMSR